MAEPTGKQGIHNGKRGPKAPWMWAVGPVVAVICVINGIQDAARLSDSASTGSSQTVFGMSITFHKIGGIAGVYAGWIAMAILGLAVFGVAGWRGLKRWNAP